MELVNMNIESSVLYGYCKQSVCFVEVRRRGLGSHLVFHCDTDGCNRQQAFPTCSCWITSVQNQSAFGSDDAVCWWWQIRTSYVFAEWWIFFLVYKTALTQPDKPDNWNCSCNSTGWLCEERSRTRICQCVKTCTISLKKELSFVLLSIMSVFIRTRRRLGDFLLFFVPFVVVGGFFLFCFFLFFVSFCFVLLFITPMQLRSLLTNAEGGKN